MTNSNVTELSSVELDKQILESKREGNVEVSGTIKGLLSSGGRFSITSIDSKEEVIRPISIQINTPNQRFFIQEGVENVLITSEVENGFKPKLTSSSMLFQSQLSGGLVDEILIQDNCLLPTLKEASQAHVIFIEELLNFFNKQTNQNSNVCPIT